MSQDGFGQELLLIAGMCLRAVYFELQLLLLLVLRILLIILVELS